MGRPLKIAKAQAILTITDTDATTEEVTVSQNLSTLGVIKGMPFIPASNIGGLVAGTTYWILKILSTTVRKLLPPGGWVTVGAYIAMYLELTDSTWRLTAGPVVGPSRTAGQGQADKQLGKMSI